jgi:hypothetical protein
MAITSVALAFCIEVVAIWVVDATVFLFFFSRPLPPGSRTRFFRSASIVFHCLSHTRSLSILHPFLFILIATMLRRLLDTHAIISLTLDNRPSLILQIQLSSPHNCLPEYLNHRLARMYRIRRLGEQRMVKDGCAARLQGRWQGRVFEESDLAPQELGDGGVVRERGGEELCEDQGDWGRHGYPVEWCF